MMKLKQLTTNVYARYACVWAALFLFYVMTQPHVFSLAHDSIGFLFNYKQALQVGVTTDWFPPFYFLNRWVTLMALSIMTSCGISIFHGILLFNAAFTALSILGFWRVCRRGLPLNTRWSLALSAALSVTFGVWGYLTTIELYALSFCVATWVFSAILDETEHRLSYPVLGILVGLSALFHIRYVLFGLCVLAKKPNKKQALLFVSISSLVFLIPLLCTGALSNGLSTQSGVTYALGWTSIAHVVVGTLRVFIGGHFLLSDYFGTVLHRIMPHHHLADEFFMLRHASGMLIKGLTVAFFFFLIDSLVVLGFVGAALVRLYKEKNVQLRILVTGVISFTVLALYADPVPVDQYMFHGVLLLSMVGLVVPYYSKKISLAIGVWIVLVAGINYLGSMHFLRSMDNDYFYHDVRTIDAVSHKNELIVYDFDFYYDKYHRLLSPDQDVVYLNRESFSSLSDILEAAKISGRSVLIHPRALSTTDYLQQRYSIDHDAVSVFWDTYQSELSAIEAPSGEIYYRLYE